MDRAFLVNEFQTFQQGQDLLDALYRADLDELKNVAYVEQGYASFLPQHGPKFEKGSVDIVEYAPDKIRLSVSLDGSGILIVSNSYSPLWKVTIDGKEGTIFPADYAFWGVALEAGNKEVSFYYAPPYRLF